MDAKERGAPLRRINSEAPIRICDNGGWSDTWFAGHGRVFSIAVSPCAEVQVRVYPHEGGAERITIHAENYGERYTIAEPHGLYTKHPLLEAALDYMPVPRDVAIDVSIYSDAPAGCSTGTSAAVSVALLGALDRLTPGHLTPHDAAMAAHKVETELLGQQCGIQDQLAAAYGGINLIEMDRYPSSRVMPIPVPDELLWELEARLTLVYLGTAHHSSDVHRMIIRELESDPRGPERLEPIRQCAAEAARAMRAGDLRALGQALTRNTGAQAALHPDLAGERHRRVIEQARRYAAWGWKVNGAGGAGGSVAILSHPDRSRKREMEEAILAADPLFRVIPVAIRREGLRVWESPAGD